MADSIRPTENDDTGKPDVSTIKKVRSSGETVRERRLRFESKADKKAAAAENPSVRSAFWNGFVFLPRLIWKPFKSLGRFRVVRLLGRILLPRYFRNSWKELRQVDWPSRRQSWRLTYAVVVFSLLFGFIVAGVDFGLDKLFKELITK